MFDGGVQSIAPYSLKRLRVLSLAGNRKQRPGPTCHHIDKNFPERLASSCMADDGGFIDGNGLPLIAVLLPVFGICFSRDN